MFDVKNECSIRPGSTTSLAQTEQMFAPNT